MSDTRRRIMRRFKINEISAVDTPAQEGALATILKRSDANGIEGDAGTPLAKDTAGNVSAIAEDHSVKIKEKINMSEDKLRELEAQLAKANALLAMTADTRGYYEGLKPKAQEAFLAKSAAEQTAEAEAAIAKAADLNTVVYTSEDGTAYTKADDARIVRLAMDNDKLMKGIREAEAKAAEAELAKRAEELANIPGSEAAKVALLKSVEGIDDEALRTEVLAALKSKSEAFQPAFEMSGVVANTASSEAGTALDQLAKDYAKKNGVTFAKAMSAVLDTPAGQNLYKDSI